MTAAPPTSSVLDEVATSPGVSTEPTPRDATAIVLDGHELGHVHADRRTLDMPLSGDRQITIKASADSPIARRRNHAQIENALTASGLG